MRTFVYIWMVALMCFSHLCYGKDDVFNSRDTVWVVNYDFSPVESEIFRYTLTIPVRPDTVTANLNYARVFWGDAQNVSEVLDISTSHTLKHEYLAGKYELVIKYYQSDPGNDLDAVADREVVRIIFNQKLQGEITLKGVNSCLESWPDSLAVFSIYLNGHKVNPPGTKYVVDVRSEAGKDMWKIEPEPSEIKDSARVIFSAPTGPLGADIRFKMTYRDISQSKLTASSETEWKSVKVYQTPDLNKIFNFKDSLGKGENIADLKNIEVCTDQELPDIRYDSLTNVKYQYSNGLPIYSLRYNFDVAYFRKDSVSQAEWQDVTRDSAMVDTVNMIFKYPGFYKIKMVAFNTCGIDSLHTDVIKGYAQRRYIQVYQGGANVFACEEDTICGIGGAGVEITFKDFGKRFDWDPDPEYTFFITRTLLGTTKKDTVSLQELPEIIVFKDGKSMAMDPNRKTGCDSVYLKIKLFETGTYRIDVKRSRFCDPPIEYVHLVTLGEAPALPLDTLWKYLGATSGSEPIHICDTFDYVLPNIDINMNNMELDSIQWCFKKKSRLDTLYQDPGTEQVFRFDSLGTQANYIKLRARNFCGWSEPVEVKELYTDIRPRVALLRDSLSLNDSLCVNMEYKYYWEGVMPEKYDIQASWSRKMMVNGYGVEPNKETRFVSTEAEQPKVGKIASTVVDEKIYEKFHIVNRANSSCYQDLLDSVIFLAPPATIFYRDTIHYCEDFLALNTKVLFESDKPNFKYVEWKYNTEGVERKTFPDFGKDIVLHPDKTDTLHVKTGNSKGCYLNRNLIFDPQEKPEILFASNLQLAFCAEDTIFPADYLDTYIAATNAGTVSRVYMKLYKDKIEKSGLLYDTTGSLKIKKDLYLDHSSKDTVLLIYEAGQSGVMANFGECIFRDTLTLKVWKPILSIEGCDTLPDASMSVYDFANAGVAVVIDTSDIDGEIAWKCVDGTGAWENSGDLGAKYTLSAVEKLKDYLEFELSGYTPCGEVLKDTLVVYLPKEELNAHTDTICNTDSGYKLWDPENGKTSGEYINPETLEWRLLEGKNGENWGQLTPDATGTDVTFVPITDAWEADTVKIEVKAWNIYDILKSGKVLTDTVCLKVNRAPENVYPDTIYLKAVGGPLIVAFEDIKVFKDGASSIDDAYCDKTTWLSVKGEGVGSGFYTQKGKSMVNIGMPPPGDKNYAADVIFTLYGHKGCSSVEAKIVMTGVMPPKVKLSNFDLCDKSTVRIDTGYRVKAVDKFTVLEWTHDGNGDFNPDTTFYAAGANDVVKKFSLKASKMFTLFNATVGSYTETAHGRVHLYREPKFQLFDGSGHSFSYDTLCLGASGFKYAKDWVDANWQVGNYTAENLTTRKSIGLTGTFSEFTMGEEVDQAVFIVSTDFGNCKRWEDVADTIWITRLKEMTGSFKVPSPVCTGSSFTVTNVSVDPMSQSYTWLASGGTLDQTDPENPVFTSNSSGAGAVSMVMTPPHGCTPPTRVSKSFLMLEQPTLVLTDTTICNGSDLVIDFVRHAQVGQIEWKANGTPFATTTVESSVRYVFKPTDVVGGGVEITGEITPKLPCTDKVVSNTMRVTVQAFPVISGSLNGEVCQGDSLDLGIGIVDTDAYGEVVWSLNGGSGELADATDLHTRYIPGEISGTQELSLTVKGLHGCPDVSKNITIRVNKSELPVVTVGDVRCAGSPVTFDHQASERPADALGKWYVDGVEKSSLWYKFNYTFDAAGEYEVSFTTSYSGKCPRTALQTVIVNPLPETDFACDSIVGSGNEVAFTNTTPGTVTHNWDFHGTGTIIGEEGGIYTHRYDLVGVNYQFTDVTLTVTDANQCSASATKRLKVIASPVAKFTYTFDRCTGKIDFKDLSQGEDITYFWELGNGYTSVDTVPKDVVYTPVDKDTTYKIRLTVSSQGGDVQFEDEVMVISTLKPRFAISPDKTGCEGKQLAKGFSNRTEGKADLYTFSWGDGSPDQVFQEFYVSPVLHKFDNPGTTLKKFTVRLTAANVCHTLSFEDEVSIYPNTISTEFIPTDTRVCFGEEINFTNESSGFGPDVQGWWHFEPGSSPESSNAPTVFHRFDKPGVYPVKLVMTDRCNTDTSEVVDIHILGDLSLSFAVETGPYCSGQQIGMKVLPELRQKFTGYHWEFGDSYSVNGVDSLRKEYSNPGPYAIRLSATSVSEGNCPVTTAETKIEVYKTPFASISPIEDLAGCAPYTVDRIVRGGTGDEQVFWDFKNGATSTEPVVLNEVFKNEGIYPIFLRLTSREGCVDTTSKIITVKRTPVVSFTVSDSLYCTPDGNISIGLENKTLQPELSAYEWSYNGHEPFSRQERPEVLSLTDEFGPIEVKLKAIDHTTECDASFIKRIVSGHRIQKSVTGDTTVCLGEPLSLTNLSEHADAADWDLGDGSLWSGDTLAYVYGESGKYKLQVKLSNEAGCRDSVLRWVLVYPLPVADFTFENDYFVHEMLPDGVDAGQLPQVPSGGISFTNHSYVDSYSFTTDILHSWWDFGDSSEVLVVTNPKHHFKNNGQYPVKLLVKTEYGCLDSVSETVYIDAVKGLFVPNAFAPGTGVEENPGVALFQPKGIGLLEYKIQVYDEWGSCVWSSDKLAGGRPAEAWDGTFNGEPLPKSVYHWKINAVFIDGTVWSGEKGHTEGHVILIR